MKVGEKAYSNNAPNAVDYITITTTVLLSDLILPTSPVQPFWQITTQPAHCNQNTTVYSNNVYSY